MKLHILSDLHIEFADFEPPSTDTDVVVLAGDIGVGIDGLMWACERFANTPVIYVPGNHEFYRQDLDLIAQLRAASPQHVHVLNDDQVVIDGVRFLGSVLWTDFGLFGEADKFFAMRHAEQFMADFSLIQNSGQPFTPRDSVAVHETSRAWLGARLTESFDGKTVVVTHHAPSARSVAPRFASNPLSPAFASELDPVIAAAEPALWIHGHTHDAFDYNLYSTRVVCNPRGYPGENPASGFRSDLVVEV